MSCRCTKDETAIERARCLAIATDVLTRGPGFPCGSEFADGYSLAAQEIAAGITGGATPITAAQNNLTPKCSA